MESTEIKISTIDYTMKVPKEGKEVVDLIDAVLEKVLSKSDIASFTELMDELYAAADNITMLDDEVKSEYRDELAGYLTHKLMGRLWK